MTERPPPSPVRWVPSLYFVQGLQFFVVMLIAGLMFKNLGIGNDRIGHWTALLGLAWAFKPLWSPFLELVRSKKTVVVAMQFTGAAGLLAMAGALQLPTWFGATLAVLFVLAYASATHDIACDGLYMASLDAKRQAAYAGWQGAFFNASRFLTLGGLLVAAGHLERQVGAQTAWSLIFVALAVLLGALATYNARVLPPAVNPVTVAADGDREASWHRVARTLREVVVAFLRKPGIAGAFLFIVLFRFAEGQVQTIGPLFLLEPRALGGLGLSTEHVGATYGTAGTVAFLVGSVLGGYFTSWLGLKRAMPVLIVAMMVPNLVFWGLSSTQPESLWTIGAAVSAEMLGYGFGFVGMILYIMQAVAPGPFQTAHYALGTGVMQLGFMASKAISGDIQQALGYERFFLWTVFAGLPVLVMMWFIRLPKPEPAAAPVPEAPAGALPDA